MDTHEQAAQDYIRKFLPDIVLIDAEHSTQAALHDHMLVQDFADFILHHDIDSDALPHLRFFYDSIVKLSTSQFASLKFIDQYESVAESYLGIGLMSRIRS
jgi:hypothetical protein